MTRTKEKSRTEQSRVDKNGLILYIRSFSTDVALIVVTSNRKRQGEREKEEEIHDKNRCNGRSFSIYLYVCAERCRERRHQNGSPHSKRKKRKRVKKMTTKKIARQRG